MSISGFFIGILLIALGTAGVKFSRQVAANLGTPMFMNKYFGRGRGDSFYLLMSLLLILLGFFVMFGIFGVITDLIFKPFRGLVK